MTDDYRPLALSGSMDPTPPVEEEITTRYRRYFTNTAPMDMRKREGAVGVVNWFLSGFDGNDFLQVAQNLLVTCAHRILHNYNRRDIDHNHDLLMEKVLCYTLPQLYEWASSKAGSNDSFWELQVRPVAEIARNRYVPEGEHPDPAGYQGSSARLPSGRYPVSNGPRIGLVAFGVKTTQRPASAWIGNNHGWYRTAMASRTVWNVFERPENATPINVSGDISYESEYQPIFVRTPQVRRHCEEDKWELSGGYQSNPVEPQWLADDAPTQNDHVTEDYDDFRPIFSEDQDLREYYRRIPEMNDVVGNAEVEACQTLGIYLMHKIKIEVLGNVSRIANGSPFINESNQGAYGDFIEGWNRLRDHLMLNPEHPSIHCEQFDRPYTDEEDIDKIDRQLLKKQISNTIGYFIQHKIRERSHATNYQRSHQG